jgi:EAL domain-containing protein (putative c-di-GMP-specific phosphodiesterase class I)
MLVEGIETLEQKNEFMHLGCKRGQGYFFHRPEFLETFIENNNE